MILWIKIQLYKFRYKISFLFAGIFFYIIFKKIFINVTKYEMNRIFEYDIIRN